MMSWTDYCKEATLATHYPTHSNQSPNLHVNIVDMQSHRFELTYRSVKLDRNAELNDFWMLVEELRGGAVPFKWKPPIISNIAGVGGIASCTETAAGSYEVVIYSAPANALFLQRGDLITFANHTKVYRVMNNVNTNNAGMATVKLNCPLKRAVNNTVLNGQGAEFTLILKPGSRPQEFGLKAGTRFVESIELSFIELL
ncbi:hypothetical protein F7U67_002098 [Vibrio metschnikovii]|nr:hypothetical protein [Vibrio metschnikovii]